MHHPIHHARSALRGALRAGAWKPLVLLVAGLTLTGLATREVRLTSEAEAAQTFDYECRNIQVKIEERLRDHEQILRSGAAFFADIDGVTREEWHEFAQRQKVSQKLPGILGIGFARLVPREQLAEHERGVRAEGFAEYRVWPEGERELYSSIVFLEPFTGRNLRAHGYDMFAEPVRRAAMEQARDGDEAVLTGRVVLVQETALDVQPGTLMYVPVYRMGAPHATVAERRAAILGWVYSPYRMGDLMDGMLGAGSDKHLENLDLCIFDGNSADPAALLYPCDDTGEHPPQADDRRSRRMTIDAAGRQWLLSFVQLGRAGTGPAYSGGWWVVLGGSAISLLSAGLVLVSNKTLFDARKIARRLTAALGQSEQRWKFALEGSGNGVWDWSATTGEVMFSNRWKSILGYAEHEIGSAVEEWSDRLHPDDRVRVLAALQAHTNDSDVPYVSEYRIACKDDSWKWVCSRGMAVSRDAAGRPLRITGTVEDITERRRVEDELAGRAAIRQALTHLAAGFVNVPVERQAVAIDESLAVMGRLVAADRAWLARYDFAAGVLSRGHEWCAAGITPQIANHQAVPITSIADWVQMHQRGQVVHIPSVAAPPAAANPPCQETGAQAVRSHVTVPLLHEGVCLGCVGFETIRQEQHWSEEELALLRILAEIYANFEARRKDEDHARELQHRLIEARDSAQAAALAKSLFLANMSHEIRTPLNAVLGYAQIMQHECGQCPNSGRLGSLIRSAEHLLELLTDLLELVRSDVREVALAPSDFDFHQILEDVRLMSLRHPGTHGLALEVSHAADLPRFIQGDSGKIRQILVNLVGNAIKFTTVGGVRMTASLLPGAAPDDLTIAVDVEDSGCGIAPDELERIFDLFEQAQHGRKSGKGTGLGLCLSRRYAQALGGDITVTSRPGQGSCFRLTFKTREVGGTAAAPLRRGSVRCLAAAQTACHVLLVDDEPGNRDMLTAMLITAGFSVEALADAAQALERLDRPGGVDLVLMDKRLPEMDGYEAIGHLRALPGGRDVPVIVVTASGAADEGQLARAAGADGYISKPVRREQLLAEIGRVTHVRYEYEALPPPAAIASEATQLDFLNAQRLPPEQCRVLGEALRRGDIRRLRELIAELGRDRAALATRMRALVDVYDYERLHELLETIKEEPV
jgi:PAS domain S-box-containing protein